MHSENKILPREAGQEKKKNNNFITSFRQILISLDIHGKPFRIIGFLTFNFFQHRVVFDPGGPASAGSGEIC